jgi:hypothetical protein
LILILIFKKDFTIKGNNMFYLLAGLIAVSILVYLCPEQIKQATGNLDYSDKVLDREFKRQQVTYFERYMRI